MGELLYWFFLVVLTVFPAYLLLLLWSKTRTKKRVKLVDSLVNIIWEPDGFRVGAVRIKFCEIVGVYSGGKNVVVTADTKSSNRGRSRVIVEVVCNEVDAVSIKAKLLRQAFDESDAARSGDAPVPRTQSRLVVIVNPISGTRSGLNLLQEFTELMQVEGAFVVISNVCITSRAGHALEMGEAWRPEQGDVVALVGGDGLLHEFGNGLLRTKGPFPLLTLIPAGTGNGFAKSVGLDKGDVAEAAFRILRSRSRPIDVLEVNVQGPVRAAFNGMVPEPCLQRFCFSSVTYGIIADVDCKSERWRWLGSARFQLEAFRQIITYVFAPGQLQVSKIKTEFLPRHRPVEVGDTSESVCVQGPFLSVVVSNVPFLSHDMKFHPWADVGDGLMDVSVVCKMSRWVLLYDLFLNVEHGTHVQKPRVKATTHYMKAEQVLLRHCDPLSVIDVDGEFLWSAADVSVEVRGGALRMIV